MSDSPILIACPHCASLNRVPRSRLDQQPKCGRCHQPVLADKPIVLTAANFDRHAVDSEFPLVVDFWAPWCGPCLQMAPQFEIAAKSLRLQARLAKVDTDAETALGSRFAIRSIPTMIVFQQGREVARQSGAMSAEQIVRWTREQLA